MIKTSSLFLSLIFFAQTAHATAWNILGPRAMGMGGAGVALAQGAVGSYWNPAGLGQVENPSGLQVPVSGHVAFSGSLLRGLNDIKTLNDNCPSGPNCQQSDINNAISDLSGPKSGVLADAGAGAELKIKKVTVFANDFVYAAAMPRVDAVNTAPATLVNNTSALLIHAISVTEFGVGYGRELPWVPGLLVGGNLKVLVGRVGYTKIGAFTVNSNNPFKSLMDNHAQSVQPGIDLGLLWDVNKTFENAWWRPRIGVTSRNINNPRFKESSLGQTDGGYSNKFSLQGNTRAGIAISPMHFWNIAADMDLTRNVTPLGGVLSQEMGIGTEVNVFNRSWINIPLRAGVRRNIAQSDAHTALTAGFGLNFLHLIVDAAGMVTPSYQQSKSVGKSARVPADIGAAVQLGFMFGGEAEKKPEPLP